MKIFLSYASEDRARAEEIQLALAGAGHEVFFDRQSLPAGGDYHERIRASVDEADLFVFLVSPDAVAEGGYALTEMGYARARWAHPKGRVLPVRVRPTPFPDIPAYLKSVTVLEPSGNTAAEVVAAVRKLAGGAGLSTATRLGLGDAASAAARERSVALKQAFDRLGVRYDGLPVVAVIRPPLTQTGDRLAYGLTAGVVQPTGQVRFTFSPGEAGRLGDALLAARAASPAAQRVIDRDKYIYRVGGTQQRQSTPTPPGVCRHVTAAG